ncbi:CLUMA_CG001661, isoform A [Clunio marinus]|uniref:CLUMA_CG001661, isoform A n=1 Tax=Clunio marinus TaxID=568069 RepID=A0A1J1HJZ8_9DIPT|nr:CLUMA_CG001661, isoform A [Clunio marinus]
MGNRERELKMLFGVLWVSNQGGKRKPATFSHNITLAVAVQSCATDLRNKKHEALVLFEAPFGGSRQKHYDDLPLRSDTNAIWEFIDIRASTCQHLKLSTYLADNKTKKKIEIFSPNNGEAVKAEGNKGIPKKAIKA